VELRRSAQLVRSPEEELVSFRDLRRSVRVDVHEPRGVLASPALALLQIHGLRGCLG
jgi:hypothetical protein